MSFAGSFANTYISIGILMVEILLSKISYEKRDSNYTMNSKTI
jgi:hypothetical protein